MADTVPISPEMESTLAVSDDMAKRVLKLFKGLKPKEIRDMIMGTEPEMVQALNQLLEDPTYSKAIMDALDDEGVDALLDTVTERLTGVEGEVPPTPSSPSPTEPPSTEVDLKDADVPGPEELPPATPKPEPTIPAGSKKEVQQESLRNLRSILREGPGKRYKRLARLKEDGLIDFFQDYAENTMELDVRGTGGVKVGPKAKRVSDYLGDLVAGEVPLDEAVTPEQWKAILGWKGAEDTLPQSFIDNVVHHEPGAPKDWITKHTSQTAGGVIPKQKSEKMGLVIEKVLDKYEKGPRAETLFDPIPEKPKPEPKPKDGPKPKDPMPDTPDVPGTPKPEAPVDTPEPVTLKDKLKAAAKTTAKSGRSWGEWLMTGGDEGLKGLAAMSGVDPKTGQKLGGGMLRQMGRSAAGAGKFLANSPMGALGLLLTGSMLKSQVGSGTENARRLAATPNAQEAYLQKKIALQRQDEMLRFMHRNPEAAEQMQRQMMAPTGPPPVPGKVTFGQQGSF